MWVPSSLQDAFQWITRHSEDSEAGIGPAKPESTGRLLGQGLGAPAPSSLRLAMGVCEHGHQGGCGPEQVPLGRHRMWSSGCPFLCVTSPGFPSQASPRL